ncbi:TPA: hypothetical protein DCZ39_00750 [Patescibacteria group bacterium]|nr:hypothetical protein [Candidatus Gracilibacteria bacterium]
MLNKLPQPSRHNKISKFFKSVVLTGTTLFVMLQPGYSKSNEKVKVALKETLEQYDAKGYEIEEAKTTAKFNTLQNNLQDPYDQIKGYVETQDMDYFNQLKTYEKTKNTADQLKDKAVVYAILQDKTLTSEQKKTLALAQFETLARMPGSNYRFSLKSSSISKNDPKYKEKSQRYYAYKSYLI